MSKLTTTKVGRPKKVEEEKVKWSAIRFHRETVDRFRRFVMVNDILSLDGGLRLLLDEVDKSDKYGRSQEHKSELYANPFQPSTSTPFRQKVAGKEPFISPIIGLDVQTDDYDLDAGLDEEEEEEGLKSLIIEGDDTKNLNRTIDDGDFEFNSSDEEQEEHPTALEKTGPKTEAVSAKSSNVLKQLAKATDLDYSNSRRLLPEGYAEHFSSGAKIELEIVSNRRFICEESQLLLLLGEKCHLFDYSERIHMDSLTALNLACISESLYYKVQRSLVFEVIDTCWEEMQSQMFDALKNSKEQVVICGDCQNDSPGNSAEFGTYTFVDQLCGYVLHIEVVDKRQVGLKSPNMEKAGFIRSVCSLFEKGVPVKEIVTDQNLQIISLFKKAKENSSAAIEEASISLSLFNDWETFPVNKVVNLSLVTHQLDIWHKARNLSKTIYVLVIQKAPKTEKLEKEKLVKWIPDIKNHFWFCAETCKGDDRLMKEKWMLCLNHLMGLHEWSTGKCEHKPNDVGDKEPMDQCSKTFDLLRSQVIGDKKFLESFHYFKNFRHTSLLESFHNVTLAYTPKRVVFDYNTMAAIDHNHHIHRKIIRDYGEAPRIEKRWSKRADDWILYFIKEKKNYSYLEHMQARIRKTRTISDSILKRPLSRSSLHPEQVAPNVAHQQKNLPEVLEKYESRFMKID